MTPIHDENGKMLSTEELVRACKKRNPEVTKFWIGKIVNIMKDQQKIKCIFDRVPDQIISTVSINFAIAMLNENTERLKEIQDD